MKTTLGQLEQHLPTDKNFVTAVVRYRDRGKLKVTADTAARFPHITLRPFLVKGREFEHEQEVRVVTSCTADSDRFKLLLQHDTSIINQVILSPYLDHGSADQLRDLIDYLLKETLRQAGTPPVTLSSINELLVEEAQIGAGLAALLDQKARVPREVPL